MNEVRQASQTAQESRTTGVHAPTISLPKGGGAIRGIGEKFAANPVTGTCSMSVPIATSPGRSGFGPQLSLTYDSGTGNGPFGFGWQLSLPAITRKTDKGLPLYRDGEESDVYILSGADDLLPVFRQDHDGTWTAGHPGYRRDAGQFWVYDEAGHLVIHEEESDGYRIRRYRPRVEGLFARIERWTSVETGEIHWRSISRDNVTTWYGNDDKSRVFDPDDRNRAHPTRIFSWLISNSYDDKGNAIVYRYVEENDENIDLGIANERNRVRTANRYLKRILYVNRAPNRDPNTRKAFDPTQLPDGTWMFEVVFDYDEAHCEEVDLDPDLSADQQHQFVRAAPQRGPSWPVRPDPFSSYRAGFEVRTYRRCRRVLMFHHVPDASDDDKGYEGLVRSTEFDYADLDYSKPVTVEGELRHQGSTRFASFIVQITQSGYVRDDTKGLEERHGLRYAAYLKKSLPPLEFEYSKASIQEVVSELDVESLENLPAGLDGKVYQFVDLDGEGVSGVLTELANAWFYKPNLGGGKFGPVEVVASRPSLAALNSGRQQLLDLAGDGQLDLVAFGGPIPGFYERTQDGAWEPFRTLQHVPQLRWDDPNLRFIDLDGDGHADILITDQDVFTSYPSLAEEGFGAARSERPALDDERGSRLVLADGTQSIFLADMSGDGLADLVRVRNGEVCYWPNVGHGRFGSKVTMDNAPRFDETDSFDQRRVRLADIDGSGTNDIIYLGRDGVRLYFNQSGNRLSDTRTLTAFPHLDNISSVTTADLLGNGTACLVWSSPLPADARRPLRYINLLGDTKPHLLVRSANNLGAETEIHYRSSTWFYLEDKSNSRPWATRLPFPVHVVERVVTNDRISGNQFVSRYKYHHGFFDGVEREFRGFGMVEQQDTETLDVMEAEGPAQAPTNLERASHVPPVCTKTWFHTGVYVSRDHVSDFFAQEEYCREPGLDSATSRALLLDDTLLPDGLTADEEREACRALKGSMLRQEIYALDGTTEEQRPYIVTEQNLAVHVLQPRASNRHAVFLAHPSESIAYHYERSLVPVLNEQIVDGEKARSDKQVVWLPDPRVLHTLTLETDEFGNVLKSTTVGYRRRYEDLRLFSPSDRDTQTTTLVTLTESSFTTSQDAGANGPAEIDTADEYRTPLPAESRTYELVVPGFAKRRDLERLTLQGVLDSASKAATLEYEEDATGVLEKRLIEHVRTYYRRNDLVGSLPLGKFESLALPFESYKLALTPGLVLQAYAGFAPGPLLEDEARYVHTEGDANWWIRSGQIFYSGNPLDGAPEELDEARRHFFLPRRYRDPFHTAATSTETVVAYDAHDLMVTRTTDPLGNSVAAHAHYRVLQPDVITDPNGNASYAAYDALGLVAGTALRAKENVGDSLAGFEADLTRAQIDAFNDVDDPHVPGRALLNEATTRVVYDLDRYRQSRLEHPEQPEEWPPVYAATLARETHVTDPLPPSGLSIQIAFSYSDGFGREVQKKIQAEPDPLADGAPPRMRWVGSGWTIFNNKGKPVRQYEPFFSQFPARPHYFEFGAKYGVSPVLFYDPLERPVAMLHPNHSWEKVVFDAWQQATWDANDTVARDPRTDDDVKGFTAGYFAETGVAWKTWLQQRVADPKRLPNDTPGLLPEQAAAVRAVRHADTPTVAYLDALGRTFCTVAHNGKDVNGTPLLYPTRLILDIEGNQRTVIDAKDRVVMQYEYDMLANRVGQASMEAGERRTLNNVAGKPIRAWDSRGFERRMTYDALQRPLGVYVEEAGVLRLAESTVYGEGQGAASNLRARVYQVFDAAGVVTNEAYDFKGNLLRSTRRLLKEYRNAVNWMANPALEDETFVSHTDYDALNRLIQVVAPHSGAATYVIQPRYNEAGLLNQTDVWLRHGGEPVGLLDPSTADLHAVRNIDYNAKGQRARIDYGNGATTRYEYDKDTFRLTRIDSMRPAGLNGLAAKLFVNPATVQDLRYTYDPVGNITDISDTAAKVLAYQNQPVEPHSCYTYDPIYRLTSATGREHIGQSGLDLNPGDNHRDYPFLGAKAHPNDYQAARGYSETYLYDEVGNIEEMRHTANGGGWTRAFRYNEESLLEPTRPGILAKYSNRLSATEVGNGVAFPPEHFTYDASGNTTRMPHLGGAAGANAPNMHWDFEDQLHHVDLGGGGTAFYVYDADGQRVRKVWEKAPNLIEEHIYLGVFEIYRRPQGAARLEREMLHVMDDKQRVALVETTTQDSTQPPLANQRSLIRYQLANHLGSAVVELDAKGEIVSYEEHTPYGSTSYQAVVEGIENSKRYRYTGNERDEESGLHYHGARYYASWIGRWVSCDPFGADTATDLYLYAGARPTRQVDPAGRRPRDPRVLEQEARRAIDSLRQAQENVSITRERYLEARQEYLAPRLSPKQVISQSSGRSPQLEYAEGEVAAESDARTEIKKANKLIRQLEQAQRSLVRSKGDPYREIALSDLIEAARRHLSERVRSLQNTLDDPNWWVPRTPTGRGGPRGSGTPGVPPEEPPVGTPGTRRERRFATERTASSESRRLPNRLNSARVAGLAADLLMGAEILAEASGLSELSLRQAGLKGPGPLLVVVGYQTKKGAESTPEAVWAALTWIWRITAPPGSATAGAHLKLDAGVPRSENYPSDLAR
jgi:RHS repeat-associated protein